MKVRLYMERVNTLNNYLKEFPPFNTDQSLADDAVVEIAYHGLPRSWKDFLLLQGFDEQEGDLSTLLEICQRIETMEKWSETIKIPTKKRPGMDKMDIPNKKVKSGHFCEYHGHNKSHDTKDCNICKSILQSAHKTREEKHGVKLGGRRIPFVQALERCENLLWLLFKEV